jgi:hypothetical protein
MKHNLNSLNKHTINAEVCMVCLMSARALKSSTLKFIQSNAIDLYNKYNTESFIEMRKEAGTTSSIKHAKFPESCP